ncbi:MAG: VanW family protein, partial [Patescibacteria group bacterium]
KLERDALQAELDRIRNRIKSPILSDCHSAEEITEAGKVLDAIQIPVETNQPSIGTGEVNDLGITEVLGVGTSNFKGSPANRVKNIRHGVNKLNGILIAPDEEFSLLAALRPFTIEDGYLPELVIKGDEIKPEVAGGLCQIGSTTFRAVMNSGLPVTERRNHSLVVSYYNDPSNGNPGTDATIYDPAPDFRFVNDTGKYILFTTSMNDSTGDLRFTFWGTNDGRKGYYSAPVVQNWIGAGEAQTRYTTYLPLGVRRCQSAHPGANASFTYTVERPDGEVEQTVYESHYRALPTICLEGVLPEQLDADGNLIVEVLEELASEAIGEEEEIVTDVIESE